jgi:hypothetical protein
MALFRRIPRSGPFTNKRFVNGIPYHPHGQPLKLYTMDGILVTGEHKIAYWDAIKLESVETKDQLTQLTEHQKTYIKVYND